MNALKILLLYVGTCPALLFIGCSNDSDVDPSTPTPERNVVNERTEQTDPPSMMSNIPHSLEDCQILSTCA